MTVTTEYGTWSNFAGLGCDRLEDSVAEFLNEFVGCYDFDGLVAAYREAINDALPEGVALCGNIFYGPYPRDYDAIEQIPEVIESIDLGRLAEKYDKTA
ncbi:MAG: hypothetical protein QJR12_16925 [Mycobacterium sp.]|uniref:hypothetical protein n=1 Tax=Mycobacterium sp. TaxID=1785 RepID=UPI00260518CA|nr:hypothetical protein [Mycobacterium sp.]MDI3315891.1 hypothetical protein [Mycobacterium sp.]